MKLMIRLTILVLPMLFSSVYAEQFNKERAISDVKEITKSFADSLKAELVAAMQAGGPTNALGVCNIEAMPITAQLSTEKNAQISRVSLKNRNPQNVPNQSQRLVLEEFNARAANGESIEKMAAVDIRDNHGKKQVTFMKAVPTGGACLACHGQQLSPDIKAKLSELYPEDKATGYTLGQVRGAIVVIKDY